MALISCTVVGACAPGWSPVDDELGFRSAPTSEVVAMSLGEATTCATRGDGEAKCWGRGAGARLGTEGSDADQPAPSEQPALSLGLGVVEIATNGTQSLVVLDDGSVEAFGSELEQLGLEQEAGPSPVPLDEPALRAGLGDDFGCARLPQGRVQCWGHGEQGQLGRGALLGVHAPADVELGGPAEQLAMGSEHACALLTGGAVRCWGSGQLGQRGYAQAAGPSASPEAYGDVPLGGAATSVVAGGRHSCALLDDGTLRCWGDNASGQLGYGHSEPVGDDETPAQAGPVPLGEAAISVVAGARHTCALLAQGRLRCWGEGDWGQLGLGVDVGSSPQLPSDLPDVELGGAAVEAVFSGGLARHTCALLDDGALRCWGLNDHGQLGLGFVDPEQPAEGPPGELPDVIIVEDPDA